MHYHMMDTQADRQKVGQTEVIYMSHPAYD